MSVILVSLLLFDVLGVHLSLTPEETGAVVKVARDLKRGVGRSPDPIKATKYYKEAVENGEGQARIEALYELSELRTQSADEDFRLLSQAANLGHHSAQHELAVAYYTGVGHGLVPIDMGRSLVLELFSSLAGLPEAHMGMGYRYLIGEGVPESCEQALQFYEYAANEAAAQVEKRGHAVYADRSRLSDDTAAVVRTAGSSHEISSETLGYYTHLAEEEGDINSIMSLASIYSYGHKSIDVDIPRAARYLRMAADAGWANAQGQLGYLLATGMGGVERDPKTAIELLTAAEKRQDAFGALGLGYCYFKGVGVEVNISRAIDLLQRVTGKHMDAAFYMGEILMGAGGSFKFSGSSDDSLAKEAVIMADPVSASQFYSQASSRGHVLASHRLAHLHSTGNGVQRSCFHAVQYYKLVAEQGDWASTLTAAHRLYEDGDSVGALRLYASQAAMGVEVAQANAAFILAKGMCPSPIAQPDTQTDDYSNPTFSNPSSGHISYGAFLSKDQWKLVDSSIMGVHKENLEELSKHGNDGVKEPSGNMTSTVQLNAAVCEARALSLYRQSAMQGNAEGFLKVGDMHYYGQGGLPPSKRNAAEFYQMAAELRHTHALFNLGVMHEVGDGVDQDFHLAKRYYDQVAEFDHSAKLPSVLAVHFLQIHKYVQDCVGRELTSTIGDIILTMISPLSALSTSKGRGGHGRSGQMKQRNLPDSLCDMFEILHNQALRAREYLERFIDRFLKSPLETMKISFNVESTSAHPKEEDLPSENLGGGGNKKGDGDGTTETLVILVLTSLFLVVLDVYRQRGRARRRAERLREQGGNGDAAVAGNIN